MGVDYEGQIEQKQQKLETVKAQMNEVCEEFKKEVSHYLKAWYDSTTRKYVGKYADISMSIGIDRLTEMKAGLKNLKDQSDAIAERYLSPAALWWHLSEGDQEYTFSNGRIQPKMLDRAVRLAMGELAGILSSNGYVKSFALLDKYPKGEIWREQYTNGTIKRNANHDYYPHEVEWSDEMVALIKQYNDLRTKARNVTELIQSIHSSEKKHQALELWGSIEIAE